MKFTQMSLVTNGRHLRRGRWPRATVFLSITTLLIAGCSETAPEPSPAENSPEVSAAPDAVPDLSSLLGEQRAVELNVEVEGLLEGTPSVSFPGSGTIDVLSDTAAVEFNVSEVPNAAGFYGHYDEIDVVYEELTAYADVVPGEAPWLVLPLQDVGPVRGFDVARLREMVIANPLLLADVAAVHGPGAGDEVDLEGAGSAGRALLEGFAATGATVAVEPAGDTATITFELFFPPVPSSTDEIQITVTMEVREPSSEDIAIPARDETTSF